MTKGGAKVGIVEASAWVAGGALLLAYAGAEWHFSRSKESGMQEFAAARQQLQGLSRAAETEITSIEPLRDVPLRVSAPDMTEWSSGRISAYRAVDHSAAPQAALHIPSINLEAPVYVGATEANLNRGAGWIEGAAPLGEAGNGPSDERILTLVQPRSFLRIIITAATMSSAAPAPPIKGHSLAVRGKAFIAVRADCWLSGAAAVGSEIGKMTNATRAGFGCNSACRRSCGT